MMTRRRRSRRRRKRRGERVLKKFNSKQLLSIYIPPAGNKMKAKPKAEVEKGQKYLFISFIICYYWWWFRRNLICILGPCKG